MSDSLDGIIPFFWYDEDGYPVTNEGIRLYGNRDYITGVPQQQQPPTEELRKKCECLREVALRQPGYRVTGDVIYPEVVEDGVLINGADFSYVGLGNSGKTNMELVILKARCPVPGTFPYRFIRFGNWFRKQKRENRTSRKRRIRQLRKEFITYLEKEQYYLALRIEYEIKGTWTANKLKEFGITIPLYKYVKECYDKYLGEI